MITMKNKNTKYKSYRNHQGHEKNTQGNRGLSNDFSPGLMKNIATSSLPVPVMDIDSCQSLAKFLDKERSKSSFPEISILPNVIKSLCNFFNERKEIYYSHQEFKMKTKFLFYGVEKQYNIEMEKIQKDTLIKITQIKGDYEREIIYINQQHEFKMKKLAYKYNLKNNELKLYYDNLDKERKAQERHFREIIKNARDCQKNIHKAIEEVQKICDYYTKKLKSNTITSAELQHYEQLIRFKVTATEYVYENFIMTLINKI